MYKILKTWNVAISCLELVIKRNIMKPRFDPWVTCFIVSLLSILSWDSSALQVSFEISHCVGEESKVWKMSMNELVSGPDMGLGTVSFLVWWKSCLLVDTLPAFSLLLRWFPLQVTLSSISGWWSGGGWSKRPQWQEGEASSHLPILHER